MSRPEAPRTNARTFPSGENAGVESPIDPTGGVVSWRFSRLSSESKKMLLGSGGESCPEKAKYLPSGDQERALPYSYNEINAEVPEYSFRSGPLRAGTRKMLVSVPDWRTNAIC